MSFTEKKQFMAAWRPFFIALTFSAIVITGCSQPTYGHGSMIGSSSGERRADPSLPSEAIQSPDFQAQQHFESAVAAWHAGRYTDAADRFRFFLHDYPEDPLRLRAEVWLARTLIAANDFAGARQIFEGMQSGGASETSRALGAVYDAFSYQLAADTRAARQRMETAVRDNPSFHVVESMTVEGDAPLIASLLADTRMRSASLVPALRDLEVVERSTADDSMREWALASGMTIAREALNDAQLDELLHAESTFQRAVAVGARVHRALQAHQSEIAAGAFHAGSPSLLSHGLEKEYVALQNSLSLSGTVNAPLYGVALSLTGPDRRAGRAALGGILLAQRSFESRPRSSDVLIEDTAGTEAGVRAAIERLCARGVPIILGPIEARLASIARESAEQCRAVYLGLETLGAPDPHLWRMSFNAFEEAFALTEYAQSQGSRRIFFISEAPQADFLEQVVDAASRHAQQRGIVIAGHSLVDIHDIQNSSRAAAAAVRRSQADTVVFAVSSSTATSLSSYLAAEGVWPRSAQQPRAPLYLGTSFVWSPTLAVNSARYVEGMVLASWLAPTRPVAEAFMRSFETTFGRVPGGLEAFAYDAASVARSLLMDAGVRDGVQAQRRLREGYNFEGATGVWRWTQEGQLHAPALVRIQNGQLVGL